MSEPRKILVALSGGVDSAVAALLLKERGFEVSAAYLRTWMNEEGSDILADCPWEEDIRQARAVAAHLGIDFEVINLIAEYRERVVDYLVDGYRRGITPNPDIMCNREIKFGVFRDIAEKNGFNAVATGHYCRRRINDDGTTDLLSGTDEKKDQSYFLALVRQEQLRGVYFPIGELEKSQVRKIADEKSLPNAQRKDSQGICFLGKVDINDFLRHYIPDRPGPIVRAGTLEILGEHDGLHHFTLGQRHGIGIPSNTDHEHFVVVGKNFDENQLVVAFDRPESPGLWGGGVRVRCINWINRAITHPHQISARVRYRDPPTTATLHPEGDTAAIEFAEPQRALASGQICAFYDGETLLGGGVYA